MSLKDIEFKDTYWSGESNLIREFYIPCLKSSDIYCRAVGYFSSSILNYISNGLFEFIKNNGKIKIVCSTNLSDEDQKSISLGYDIREIIKDKISIIVDEALEENTVNIKNLCWLVKNDILDIKVCYKISEDNKRKLFHEKFGYFSDSENNVVSFLGSVNETLGGWVNNEESFEVSMNWIPALEKRVEEKIIRFNKLWLGTANNVATYDFPKAVREKLINHAPEHATEYVYEPDIFKKKLNFKPRKCQEDAKEKFIQSNYKCLFMMATGSGKTKAAMYSMCEIDEWKVLLILVPSIELVNQWERDVNLFYPDIYIIKCSSEYPKWKQKVLSLVQAKIPNKTVIISTYDTAISSYAMDKWLEIPESKFAIIFDEAHNMGADTTQKIMELNPNYRIGLSATPKRNFDEEGSDKIINYFGNNIHEFLISDAISKGYLVNYEYYIMTCELEDEDWDEYISLTKKIKQINSYIEDKERHYKEKLRKLYGDRANIIKKAEGKIDKFDEIFRILHDGSRILIYGESLEQLHMFEDKLNSMNKYYFMYTGDKDAKLVRPIMLEEFKQGIRKILLAIGCLDEGIDIPICDAAIFVSSSTSEREFIQRRGRVLRCNPSKNRAYIFDFFVYPKLGQNVDDDERKIARSLIFSQYKRINQIADDAINGISERLKLDDFLSSIGLNPYNY